MNAPTNSQPSSKPPSERRGTTLAPSLRTKIVLACQECESRNYRTTRKPEHKGQLALKKFCPNCKRHTLHKETK